MPDSPLPQLSDGPEFPLLGGDVTVGIVRVGQTVRRPRGPNSDLVEALLTYLQGAGFAGAPRFLGIDSKGRQALTFVDGEVAGRPWPDWVAEDDTIASVARLVREYDDAAQGFGIPDDVTLEPSSEPQGIPLLLAGPETFVGHMDITPENVVFKHGKASALIDFDLARPSNRVREVCNLLMWWAPLMPVGDREVAVREVNAIARAALLVDAYGLDSADRAQLVATACNSADRAWYLTRERAERLGGGWARMWDDGVGDRIKRRQDWLGENAERLNTALRT